ncbi:hypothetical protein K492DRAFT_177361 [Lichtheimia hyalospora FSU 10163]|nr:hypothetical protein K492DRAFT_177361 [Lichtheimia hyalospora FSU 10163]
MFTDSHSPESRYYLDDFILNWLKQPGNYARYARANGKLGIESRKDVADEVIELYRQSGGTLAHHTIRYKIWDYARQYCRAHAVARSGGSRDEVLNECLYYYDIVDGIGEDCDIVLYDHNKNVPVTELELPRRQTNTRIVRSRRKPRQQEYYKGRIPINYNKEIPANYNSKEHQEMIQMMDAVEKQQRYQHEQMNQFLDQRQSSLNQQSQRHRVQEMQIQASLLLSLSTQMKHAGFSENEIASHIKLLGPLNDWIQSENEQHEENPAS